MIVPDRHKFHVVVRPKRQHGRVVRFSESSLSRQLEDENEELRKELSNEKMRVAQTEWFATDEVLKKQWE